MKAKNQPKPTVLLHTVEFWFAEAEDMGRISSQSPSIGPWTQHVASSEYPCRCNQRWTETSMRNACSFLGNDQSEPKLKMGCWEMVDIPLVAPLLGVRWVYKASGTLERIWLRIFHSTYVTSHWKVLASLQCPQLQLAMLFFCES